VSRDREGYSGAAHVDRAATHEWGDPPPGSGNLPVCRKCGAKQTAGRKHEACDGLQNESFDPTQHDYDPF